MYIEYKPDIRLSHLIDCYWISEGVFSSTYIQKILPDGCIDVIVNIGHTDSMKAYEPYIVGTITKFIEVEMVDKFKMAGVRLKPGALSAFTNIPADEFTDKHIETSLINTIFNTDLFKKIFLNVTELTWVSNLNSALVSQLNNLNNIDLRVNTAITKIYQSKGNMRLEELMKEISLCPRQFERRFKSSVGISPKRFSRIIRFNNTLDIIKSDNVQSLFAKAFYCGYYDQAHLIKDFKSFTGGLPSEFFE